jgi:SAM-dependent methyltransferase
MADLPEHVATNRAFWDELATNFVASGRRNWESEEPAWGIFGVPESEVGMLPRELDGRDAIELGCGTGYVSAWLARRGANPVGIDNSEAQLETARGFQREFGLEFPLLHGDAERVPYPDASFDLAISEYGASIWCDPYAWIPEAARLLRPGGELVFLCNSIFTILCGPDDETIPVGDQLLRPLFGMHRVEWPGEDSVEFHLPPGKMIALLRDCGLELTELIEVRPPADTAKTDPHVPLDWARRYPCEEVWRARKP